MASFACCAHGVNTRYLLSLRPCVRAAAAAAAAALAPLPLRSGPTAYLTTSNGWPLAIAEELAPVASGPFKGHRWASPSQPHLRSLLRAAHADPAAAKAKGERARRDMAARFSPEALGAELRALLEGLAASNAGGSGGVGEAGRTEL